MLPPIQMLPVEQLLLNEENPRDIKDEQFFKLVQSLVDFPEMFNLRPIIVNEAMVILGGNMRYRAAVHLGFKEVPTIVAAGLTPEQEMEFVVKDNASFGEWDMDKLANWFDTDKLQSWGIDVPDWHSVPETSVDLKEKSVKDTLPTTHVCPNCKYEF